MSTQWDALLAAVGGIISGAGGATRTVPAGFVSAALNADLADAESPPIVAERLFELEPITSGPVNPPMANPLSPSTRETITLALTIAYRTDIGGPAFPSDTPGDSLTRAARVKAANDWWVIYRALCWPANWGDLSDGNTLVRIAPSAASFDMLRDGVVATRVTLVCEIDTNPYTLRDLG